VEFQAKILARSGLGDDTYLPPNLAEKPPAISMSDARWEFEQVGCGKGAGAARGRARRGGGGQARVSCPALLGREPNSGF
jgi:hypothetical protein